MNRSHVPFASELRLSHRWLIVLLAAIGVVLFLAGEFQGDEATRIPTLDLALLALALSVAVWWLDDYRPWIGPWAGIGALVALIYLGNSQFQLPGLLSLMVVPTALAASLVSLPVAFVTAVVQTLLLLLAPGIDPATANTTLAAIWMILGVMSLAYQPVYRMAHRTWQYYERARMLLAEARDRKVELEQALEDLAHTNLQLTRLNLFTHRLRELAEDARTAKEEFVANVSHELRTPLNMITGFSEMILSSPGLYGGQLPPMLLADLTVIHRNAGHLSDLIDDVLDLSQIDAEQMALTKNQTQFSEIVDEARIAVRPLFEAKGLFLDVQIPVDLPPVYCDRTRIREVLLNLLSNAGRFTECGGVHLGVRQENNAIQVAVSDTGPGVPAEEMERLFQPFHQMDGTIRRRHGGTGLGLSISKRFIELHGGRIWVENEPGGGMTFTFSLPMAPTVQEDGSFLRGLTPDWEYLQRHRSPRMPRPVVTPRFVVLESGDMLLRLLSRYWTGVELVAVANLEQAINELARVPAQALLVNDLAVGQALERLGSSARLPRETPVIICAVPDPQNANPSLGVSAYLVKPISHTEMLETLDHLQVETGTVLIVDDEPDALHLFERMLAASGRDYNILLARDGEEALEILQEQHPDVILLDLIMPRLDGFRLLEMRSQDPRLQAIPTVIISARDPAGQPVLSMGLAVTRGGGLSVRKLLEAIEALSRILGVAGPVGDLAEPRMLPG